MTEKVVIVDENDFEIGFNERTEAHLGEGILHRAFAVFVFNDRSDLLLQKRSKHKMLWSLFWDSTCAGHPRIGEGYESAAERRLKEEFGFTCKLELIGKFQYQAAFEKVGSENEICAILVGRYSGNLAPDFKEISKWKWMNTSGLKDAVKKNPSDFTPWFRIGLDQLEQNEIL